MKIDVKFSELTASFDPHFGEVHDVSDGGFERGYAEGYTQGNANGYANGYAEGLADRKYEVWTITLTDGTVIEKEVALL